MNEPSRFDTHNTPPDDSASATESRGISEDVLAIVLGVIVLLIQLAAVWLGRPQDYSERVAGLERQIAAASDASVQQDREATDAAAQAIAATKKSLSGNPLKSWIAKPEEWSGSWLGLVRHVTVGSWQGLVGALALCLVVFGLGTQLLGRNVMGWLPGFVFLFALATLAFGMAEHESIAKLNLEYPLWALLLGLLISNLVGTADWMRGALMTEFYIKSGLVILGAEVLIGRLLSLGVPGIFVAWVVTPIVLISTFIFGQRILKIPSPSLNMVISADMSVCGVSAAIATAAACRAKKEELSLAIGMSLGFTVIMMFVLPLVIQALGMDPVLGGAWLGGTIDSTGAVAAAGAILGDTALQVAATVKMIQNILIGVVALCVAVYWVSFIERDGDRSRVGWLEVWRRFPKFVLGFVLVSIVCSTIQAMGLSGELVVDGVVAGSKSLRGWFFCLAFVSIGLETNFRQLASQLHGGKPLILYVCGQTLNLLLTLLMAWLMFKVVFPDAAQVLGS